MSISEYIIGIFVETFALFSAMAPYLLLGFGVAGLLHVFISSETVYRHLGGRGFVPLLKAVFFGVPLPLCSCGVIPVAAALRRDGASRAAALAFLVATPTTGVDSIFATLALMGPLFAIFRPIAAIVGGLFVGIATVVVFRRENIHNHEVEDFESIEEHKQSFARKILDAIKYGYGELVTDIGKTLLWAVLVGGVISFIVPAPLIERYLGNPVLSFIVMLAIAVPMYVCSVGSIPIAAALIAKGMNPGAALVFLIAGPATNTVTIAVVSKQFGKKAAILYIGSVIITAVVMGIGFDVLWNALDSPAELISPIHARHSGPPGIIAAIVLITLILRAIIVGKGEKLSYREENLKFKFKVPDMSCKHCVIALERAVGAISGVEKVVADLESKTVSVDGDVTGEEISRAIKNAGYTAEDLCENK